MAEITKNTDADTFRIDGESTRVLGINTAESVAVHESRNTDAGKEASDRAKVIAPTGTEVRTTGESKGTFGRKLQDVKLQTADGEVDYGLVALDQGMSKYSVDYGEHPDPEQHDIFKEYFSPNAPYQYGEDKPLLTEDEYNSVATNIAAFTEAEQKYKDGDITRQDFDKAMYAAYGDGKKVAQFRFMNHQWDRDFKMKDFDGSDRAAYDWANQSPENKQRYNRAVRNSHTGMRTNPEQDEGFWNSLWDDTQTTFSALNDFAVLSRHTDLTNARKFSDGELDVPDEELIKGLSPEWHDKVMQEAANYGDDAALQYRDNLLISMENEEAMAEMPLVTQIATAVPAVLLSPATLIPGAKVAQGTYRAGKAIDGVLKVGRLRHLRIPAKVSMWAAAGGTEAGISAIPRFATDDTFTSMDMLNEMKWGAAFGAAVPVALKGASVGTKRLGKYQADRMEIQKKIQAETEARVDNYQAERDVQYSNEPLVPKSEFVDPKMKGVNPDSLKGESFKTQQNILKKYHNIEVADEAEMSKLLAEVEAVEQAAVPKTATGVKIDSVAGEKPKPKKVLTNDDLDYLDNADDGIPQAPKPKEDVKALKDARDESRKALELQAWERVDKVLKKATVPYQRGKTAVVVDTSTGNIAKSFTQTMLESPSHVAKFIGSELLELPEGMGGKVIRRPSAALQQHSLKTRYLTQTQPSYHKLIGQYAAENGKRGVGRFMAQHADGQNNTMVRKFSRDVATVLEQRRQGRTVTVKSPSVLKMVDEFEASMGKMFDDLVDAGVVGFKKDRRIQHYFPQLWDDGGIRGAISKHGRTKVQSLLAKGYLGSKHNKINSMSEAMHVADNFLTNLGKVEVDGAMPASMDSRAKQRLDIDTTVTDGELSIMDLMTTDFSTVTAKYTNRAAGQVSLANKGIKSDLDIEAMRERLVKEGGDEQHFEDAMNIVMGRPTRDGLDPGLNEIKDSIALSKMGGLGMAQAAELGNVLARTTMQLLGDPKVAAKVFGMGFETKAGKQLMAETQALSGISNDVHLLDRQATHLDRNEMDKINRVRSTAQWIAGKASFGSLKAPAGYLLSQGSGFNMIRRFERRVANASFLLDVGKHFKNGTGVMSEARMRDIGLDPKDRGLIHSFRKLAEYDENGMLKTLNLDKWDKGARERLHLAMYRDDAQMVQQNIGGENTKHLNKPAMTLLMQFKQSALLANKKQLTRSMQFADKEAVLGTTLNIAMAALTRTAKFGTLGAAAYTVTGDDKELEKPWEKDYWEPEKYVAQFGFFPDMGHIAYDSYKAWDEDRMSYETVGEGVAKEIPVLGWMKDYYDIGTADSLNEKADAAKGVAILGNMQFADIIYKGLEAQLED